MGKPRQECTGAGEIPASIGSNRREQSQIATFYGTENGEITVQTLAKDPTTYIAAASVFGTQKRFAAALRSVNEEIGKKCRGHIGHQFRLDLRCVFFLRACDLQLLVITFPSLAILNLQAHESQIIGGRQRWGYEYDHQTTIIVGPILSQVSTIQ